MDPSITIVGPGAVGQMLAYFLQDIAPVYLRGRKGSMPWSGRVQHLGRIQPLTVPEKSAPSALWIVATKAYDLEAALLDVVSLIPRGATLVLLANGYIEPSVQKFRLQYPQIIWQKGLVSRGCRFLEDGTLALSDSGAVLWGHQAPASELEQRIFGQLKDQHFIWDKDACERRREKWIFNAVLNTICGAHRLPRNGLAPAHPDFEPLMKEVSALAKRLWPDWNFSEKNLRDELLKLIGVTRDNENSMARDLRLHRRTEADFLSGHVLAQLDAPLKFPLLFRLHQQILAA